MDYESCYCPEGKDPNNPENWRRKNYILDYPQGIDPDPISDADLFMVISKEKIANRQLDFYTLGVFIKIQLLKSFHRPITELYEYGTKENVDKALSKLKTLGYIKENLN